MRQRIEPVLGQWLTEQEWCKRLGGTRPRARRWRREAAILGCEVTQDGDEFMVTLPSELAGLEQFKRTLYAELQQRHAELQRRRKEARDGYHSWRPDNVHTARQSKLCDWIEDEFVTLLEMLKVP